MPKQLSSIDSEITGKRLEIRPSSKGYRLQFEHPNGYLFQGDAVDWLASLKSESIDLIFADPPYNLNKSFGGRRFRQTDQDEYEARLMEWLGPAANLLRPNASVYICGDWRSSSAIQRAGSRLFTLRNRITWEREKGRGSKRNWKNASEDIWFFTVSDDHVFDRDAAEEAGPDGAAETERSTGLFMM